MKMCYVIVIFITFLLGCSANHEGIPCKYKGDGEISFVKSPRWPVADGWMIEFNKFELSESHVDTYNFSGLPKVKNIDFYNAYLFIPASVRESFLEDAWLRVDLYSNQRKIYTYNAKMKDWICGKTSTGDAEGLRRGGDGIEKWFGNNIKIPADPSAKYKLTVRYTPPDFIETKEQGYFFLITGTGK